MTPFQPPKPSLNTRLDNEIRLREYTESVLDCRQDELETQEVENAKLHKKLDLLEKELLKTQTQLKEARHQVKLKSKQLQDVKDQIFDLQPQRQDITESEAQDSYKKLLGNVQRWIESRMTPIFDELDTGTLTGRHVESNQATRFVSLMRDPAKCCVAVDQSDEFIFMGIIMNYLWHVFFTKSFYCPLDDSDTDIGWINQVQSAMSKLPRDVGHCREWRSETLTAITSQSTFKARRNSYIDLISEDLASLLSAVVPDASPTELQVSISRSIVEPAADLAHRLHLAPRMFALKWTARSAWSRLEAYECINLAAGGTPVDLQSTISSSSSAARQKMSYLFDVAPGLFVERQAGYKSPLKTVCKPKVLVYPGNKEVPQTATVAKWLWDHSSILQDGN